MLPLKNILCPVDLTPHSGKAMKVAMELAQHFKPAVVHCMNVVINPDTADSKNKQAHIDQLVQNAQSDLHEFIEKYTLPEVTCVPHIKVGSPAELIVDFAETYPVDLIVMATHGREGLTHYFVGSVAEKVVQQSKVPVLTIRPDQG